MTLFVAGFGTFAWAAVMIARAQVPVRIARARRVARANRAALAHHLERFIVLAHIESPALPHGKANTVILRWSDLGALTLTAQTVNGRQCVGSTISGPDLFNGLWPGPRLENLARQLTDDRPFTPPTPLLIAIPDGDALHLYHRVQSGAADVCFLYTTTVQAPSDPTADVRWLHLAVEAHAQHADSLNNHECHWRKAFPGQELEYKYTLPPGIDIWRLAADTHRRVRGGQFPGFALKYHDEVQTWDYLNHLFDIEHPASERGYVAFIPSITTPGWRAKRKWFTADSFARREELSELAPLTTSLDVYVRDVLDLRAKRMPTFRRLRYDINVESLRTGHHYGIFFDRCHLIDHPSEAMSQCEIEYWSSRTTGQPAEAEILDEMQQGGTWVEALLAEYGLPANRTHYSKRSFLRDAAARIRSGRDC